MSCLAILLECRDRVRFLLPEIPPLLPAAQLGLQAVQSSAKFRQLSPQCCRVADGEPGNPVLSAAQARRAEAQHQQAARQAQVCRRRPADGVPDPSLRSRSLGCGQREGADSGNKTAPSSLSMSHLTCGDASFSEATIMQGRGLLSHACASPNVSGGKLCGGFDATSMPASLHFAAPISLPLPSLISCHGVACRARHPGVVTRRDCIASNADVAWHPPWTRRGPLDVEIQA